MVLSRICLTGMVFTCLLVPDLKAAEYAGVGSGRGSAFSVNRASSCDLESNRLFELSSDSDVGGVGWLLCFDPRSTASWLYKPPFVLQMQAQWPNSPVKLKSEDLPDLPDHNYYTFEGKLDTGDSLGTLVLHSDSVSSGFREYVVHVSEVDREHLNAGSVEGRYSNVRYVKESGDLVGIELLIFRTRKHLSGLITFYEGFWDEPIGTCLVLSNVRLQSDQIIRFDHKSSQAVAEYTLTRTGKVFILRRTDVSPGKLGEKRLRRQRQLTP